MTMLPERTLTLLIADDPASLRAFYQVCGFVTVWHSPNYTELHFGDYVLALTDRPFMAGFLNLDIPSPHEVEVRQHAFVISLHSDAVDEDVRRLLEAGAGVVMPPTDQPWGQRVAYLSDPEGNLLEIAQKL